LSFQILDLLVVAQIDCVKSSCTYKNPQSPITGLPILNADKAKPFIVSSEAWSKGLCAELENELFRLSKLPDAFRRFAKQTITEGGEELKGNSEGIYCNLRMDDLRDL